MSAIVWVHWDALASDHPVMTAAPEEARRVFVWDAQETARRDWSLKRCVFILECLEDLDVELLEGRPSDILNGLNATEIYTAYSPDPYIRVEIDRIEADVTIVKPQTFVSVPDSVDMKRFFRYWNKAKKSVLHLTEDQAGS